MKILIVGGTFDKNSGKESGLVNKMYNFMIKEFDTNVVLINGGLYEKLKNILESVINYDVVFWMANVPNDLPKIRNVKDINPHVLLVGSKRNDNNKYSFVDVLNRSLEQKNNLSIEFKEENGKFKMLVFDPLGTAWYEGFELEICINCLLNRIRFILNTKREHTFRTKKNIEIENNEEFFQYTRKCSEIFHQTIQHSDGVTRFLGNSSFRGNNGIIYVTRRDVDKRFINKENFVASFLEGEKVYYVGDNKPSKDTVVQTRLYKMLPNINYIVHSHCYVEDGYFTKNPVPCGALDEIDEVLSVIEKDYDNNLELSYYKINLIGHGCLIFGKTIQDLQKTNFVTRYLPEKL